MKTNFSISKIKILFVIIFVTVFFLYKAYQEYEKGEIKVFSYVFQTKLSKISKDDIKVFIVNLDRTPERYEKIKKLLAQNNLDHERFSATDGYELEIINKKTGDKFLGKDLKTKKASIVFNEYYDVLCPSGKIEYFSNKELLPKILGAGEFGCFCSHIGIWDNMVKNNIKYALILEDDASFIPTFQEDFNSLISNLPYKWDFIYLFLSYRQDARIFSIMNNHTIKKLGEENVDNINTKYYSLASTVGYLITLDSAKKLLEFSKNFPVPIDHQIAAAINSSILKGYFTSKPLLTHPVDPNDSSLKEMGRD